MGLNLRMHRKLSTKMGTKNWSDAGKGVFCQPLYEAPLRRLNQSPIGIEALSNAISHHHTFALAKGTWTTSIG